MPPSLVKAGQACPKARDDIRLCGSRVAVEKEQTVFDRSVVECPVYHSAPGLIPARQDFDPPADLAENSGERPRPLTSPPAIDKWSPPPVLVGERAFYVASCISGDEGRTDLARKKGALLHVNGSDAGSFGIIQNRKIDCTRDMVLLVFSR